jgi:hypothetical protein
MVDSSSISSLMISSLICNGLLALIVLYILYWVIRLAVRGALLDVDRRREAERQVERTFEEHG